jgi:anti-sigma regulatory factor (Ser/Thr protein kinase)
VGRVDKCLGSTALEFRWSFAPEPAASARARQRLTPILTAWGLSSQQSHDALLVANELVANAVDHARTPLDLLVSFSGVSVLIEVRDGSVGEPRLQAFDRTAPRGRGLQFVDALAHRWSWKAEAHGKVVWAEMAVDGSDESPEGCDEQRLVRPCTQQPASPRGGGLSAEQRDRNVR